MKRAVVVLALLGLAAPALANDEQPAQKQDQKQQVADQQAVAMTDAELDDVSAGGYLKILGSQFAVNVAFVSASGSSEVNLTQVAVAIGELNVY